jgi:apolipoprotein N-acyltransferase
LFGLVSVAGVFHWIFEIEGFRFYHGVFLAIYLALFPAAWCAALPRMARKGAWLLVTAPSLWVLLEYLKAHAGFMALPWGGLAHSQYSNTALIQLAAFTGEQGVTFLLVMTNMALARVIHERRWRASLACVILVASLHVWGGISLGEPDDSEKLRVAVIQPAISLRQSRSPNGREAALERLLQLSRETSVKEAQLIVWPENAVPDLQTHITVYERVRALARELDAPVITGASEYEKFSNDGSKTNTMRSVYNAAYFVPGVTAPPAPYRKRILVPFGEYLPLDHSVNWPTWLISRRAGLEPGDEFRHFTLQNGLRVSPIICWENLFASFVRSLAQQQPDLIVQLTNDNWFGRSTAPHQHNAASIFRAVENRTPIAIASNTGPALIIGPRGQIIAEGPKPFTPGAIAAAVPLQRSGSVYTLLGDWFVIICLIFLWLPPWPVR